MKRLRKRLLVTFVSVVFSVLVILSGLQISVVAVHNSWEHWKPNYEKQDISALLEKTERTQEDYETLYAQTGLTKLGIDGLIEANRKDRILKIQEFYFKDVERNCKKFFPYTYIEEMNEYGLYCALEAGDIIVSATTHSVFLRVGHAVIVLENAVVGDGAIVAESLSPGTLSTKSIASLGLDLANYMVLRPTGIPKEIRAKAVEYASKEMQGLKYDFTIGIFSKKFAETPTKTNCAHLCWYPYKKFGYDVDGNGGLTVKPQDIANSPYMEVVQIYGFNPQKLWK